MKKLVIHIFHTHENALITGAKLSERIQQVAGGRGVALEIFIFGPAIAALVDPAQAGYHDALVALAKSGVPVIVCRQTVEDMGKADLLQAQGFTLEYARDAFIRFALDGATVISL